MKIKHIALAALLSSTMMISNSANAQLTITGYTETNLVTGSSKGALNPLLNYKMVQVTG